MKIVKNGDFFARQGWYPAESKQCERTVEKLSKGDISLTQEELARLQVGVVPHAGWSFSGGLAALVFKALASQKKVDRVVLFGGHMGPHSRGWILREGAWQTPLGSIEGDAEFAQELASLAGGAFSEIGPQDYEPDNTLELQLPFIKYFMEEARIVVAGVPATQEGLALGRQAAEIASNAEGCTVIVGSTDLTHYGLNYGFTPKGLGEEAVAWVKEQNDRQALDQIEALDAPKFLAQALKTHNACCPGASGAALAAAKVFGSQKGHVLGYLTSYDVHPGPSFVGYVAAVA